MRVLIVDDSPLIRATLEAQLSTAGYEVYVACSADEALRMVRKYSCRLVISDWEMPGMSGVDLCRLLRQDDSQGYMYLILLTAHSSEAEKIEGLSAGADDFVTKPFNPAELIARVRIGERVLGLETRHVAIFALAKLAESRDPETGAHLERVRGYSKVLAEKLAGTKQKQDQIAPEFVRLIYETSPLHDIGKVGIPDHVLLKPGRLSEREFEIMRAHTIIGAETLAAAMQQYPEARFLSMAHDIALTHHERYDGSGYPQGLAGDRIPLAGRIVALADVYDALTSKRVYKQAYPHEVASSVIIEERGRHFDPDVVDAFVACEDAFQTIHARYAEQEAVPT
jgi:putative two-component system response regulator